MFHQIEGEKIYNVHFEWEYRKNGVLTQAEAVFVFDILKYNTMMLYHRNATYRRYYNKKNWNVLYKEMYNKHHDTLLPVYQFFNQYRAQQQLSDFDFIHCVAKFVQHIPYVSLTWDQDLASLTVPDDSYITLADYTFGILPPIICITLELGDCDTKSLLLYILLNHFNIKTAMLEFITDADSHSVVCISHPSLSQGLSLMHDSSTTPYFLFDTTTKREIGEMTGPYKDLNLWKLILPPLALDPAYKGFPASKYKHVKL
jgi:hypothetical protein